MVLSTASLPASPVGESAAANTTCVSARASRRLEVVITREADVSDRARALGARARAAPATGAGRAPMAIDEADMPAGRPVGGSTRASESGSGE